MLLYSWLYQSSAFEGDLPISLIGFAKSLGTTSGSNLWESRNATCFSIT
jgi:hypothetical protein